MPVVETVNFVIGFALFANSVLKAVYEYMKDDKVPLKGGRNGVGIHSPDHLPKELPSAVDIKKKLPKECFESSVAHSMYYVVKDLIMVSAAYSLVQFAHSYDNLWLYWASLLAYWAFQGTLFMSIFVVGHDCGHDSFSKYRWLNEVVGNLMHTIILVPFYMWKLSHRHHHKHTGNFDKDEVFYPTKESQHKPGVMLPGFGFGLAWFAYLYDGYGPVDRRVNHFNPNHPMFRKHFWSCVYSLICLASWSYLLYCYTLSNGFLALLVYYLVPVLIFASYLCIITFLHHTEENIPWYANSEWDFVKGQLSTIDRDYGIIHHIIHTIGTHQMHHMFTRIPHYRLEQATGHFRKNFPELVRICNEPILPSFMRMFRKFVAQSVIPDDTKRHAFK